jgi:TolB-like protein/Tfp pilus assembly protein PilF
VAAVGTVLGGLAGYFNLYRSVAVVAVPAAPIAAEVTRSVQTTTPDRPPIAVLDFADPKADAKDQQVARAYAEELTAELARNADLRVISPRSSLAAGNSSDSPQATAQRLGVTYLVGGRLTQAGEIFRLAVQLIDGRDGRIVWSDRHDMHAVDVYKVRDSLAERIAGTLHSSMRYSEENRAGQRPPASMDVYAMTLRAISLKHRFTPTDMQQARELLEKVVATDSEFAPGWLYLGMVNAIDSNLRLTPLGRPEIRPLALEQIERSVRMNPSLPAAYYAMSFVYGGQGKHEEQLRVLRQCVALGPGDADCLLFLAEALAINGLGDEALQTLRHAQAITPFAPIYFASVAGYVLWVNRDDDGARVALDDCLSKMPQHLSCRRNRALLNAEAGQLDQARSDAAQAVRLSGEASFEALVRSAPQAPAVQDRRLAAARLIDDGARVAGK